VPFIILNFFMNINLDINFLSFYVHIFICLIITSYIYCSIIFEIHHGDGKLFVLSYQSFYFSTCKKFKKSRNFPFYNKHFTLNFINSTLSAWWMGCYWPNYYRFSFLLIHILVFGSDKIYCFLVHINKNI
jgi:hypothetical protein